MIKHFLITSWRNLLKNRSNSAINIFGLSVGIAVFLVIVMFVSYELSYDKFYSNAERIYRLEYANNNPWMNSADGPVLFEELPEVVQCVRFKPWTDVLVKNENTGGDIIKTQVSSFALADSSLFDVFDFKFIQGSAKGALNNEFEIVLTESVNQRLFGNEPSLGKLVNAGGRNYTVTGVVEDLRPNTHLSYEVFGSFVSLAKIRSQKNVLKNYTTQQYSTYLLVPEIHDVDKIADKATAYVKKNYPEVFNAEGADVSDEVYYLRPLTKVYLTGEPIASDKSNEAKFVYTLLFIAILIIVIAGINYVNLTTALFSTKYLELGIKKVIGARAITIFQQMFSESVMITFISGAIAIVLSLILLPYFNNIVGTSLNLAYFLTAQNIFIFIAGLFLVGIIAGSYPSLFANRLNSVQIIKGETVKGKKQFFRNGLTIFQFGISISLIVATLLIVKQLDFLKNKDLGFDQEHVLMFGMEPGIKKTSLKNHLLQNPNIKNVGFSNSVPGLIYNWEPLTFNGRTIGMPVFAADPDFFKVYGLDLVDGRFFANESVSDQKQTCILNEEAVRQFELEHPVGEVFQKDEWYITALPTKSAEVIGVVKNFHFQSLHNPIGPMAFAWNEDWEGIVSVKLSGYNISETMDYIRAFWATQTEYDFDYRFMDASFDQQYKAEEKLGKLISFAAGLTIFISCLGIFGLALFSIQRRIKEIGIRKVNGAKTGEVMLILNKDFIKWVGIAYVLACPAIWLFMNKWLANFAYKTTLSWWIFLVAGVFALMIALLTVSWQSYRAAMRNPVEALRYE